MSDSVLLNDGTSFVLLNDGTSQVLLNAHVAAPTGGVDISGTHAIADLRGLGAGRKPKRKTRQICIMVNGKISCIFPMPTGAKLFRTIEVKLKSKLSKIIKTRLEGKLWNSRHFEAKSRINRIVPKTTGVTTDEYKVKIPFSLSEKHQERKVKKIKLKKLKKLFDAYKESQNG